MASLAPSDSAANGSDGPVLSLINKRLRALRKKFNRILQMEESAAQGKPLNKEQEDVLRSKPAVAASIEELEKLHQPLAAALSEEISLALGSVDVSLRDQESAGEPDPAVEDLLNLLYFGSLFDVKSQSEFTSTMLTRTHERGCCLTYDYVTDDATDLLGERDLDLISMLSGLLTSRPVDSRLSHKNALQRCVQHAKHWLDNSDQPIGPDANITYAGLKERLKKIMVSDYYTTTPEMKAPGEVAAAAAGNYASFQVPMDARMVPITVPVEVEGSSGQYQRKVGETEHHKEPETGDNQSVHAEEFQKDEQGLEDHVEIVSVLREQGEPQSEGENDEIDQEVKEQQYIQQRSYQNQRGGRGGRRDYLNGRGRRGGGRGASYQNGRSQYYDQPRNYYPRNYYNNRGRGGRGGGHAYNQGGRSLEDVSVAL